LILGPILLRLNDSATVYVPVAEVAPGLRTDPSRLTGAKETVHGPQAHTDQNSYSVWQKTDATNGPAGRYLVDASGAAVYLVDPGINGVHSKRPDGTTVRKFDAPKATLMSYIIKGILDRQLPWSVVLFGVMIAIVLEMSGIPSLAFAVGVYLPIATSMPVFIGGLVRWLVDRRRRKELINEGLDEVQLAADADRSPGVLAASGYIAGGAIAGILIAITQGVPKLEWLDALFTRWSRQNPFVTNLAGWPTADFLALIPFALLIVVLYFAAREKILTGRKSV
jgi:hypothetical protein